MKRSTLGYPLAALTIFFSLIAGCASTPRADFAKAQDAYIATVQVLVDSRAEFTEEEWQEDVLPLINTGDAALDQYDALTKAGLDPDSATATIRTILDGLRPFLERVLADE